jgi:hypothetical protein
LNKRSQNPPNRNDIPPHLEYVRLIGRDSAYVEKQGKEEPTKSYRRRLYNAIKLLLGNKQENVEMRFKKIWSDHDWATIWENLHIAPVSATTMGEWYRIIHDLIPTNERLHKIRPSQTDMQCM